MNRLPMSALREKPKQFTAELFSAVRSNSVVSKSQHSCYLTNCIRVLHAACTFVNVYSSMANSARCDKHCNANELHKQQCCVAYKISWCPVVITLKRQHVELV